MSNEHKIFSRENAIEADPFRIINNTKLIEHNGKRYTLYRRFRYDILNPKLLSKTNSLKNNDPIENCYTFILNLPHKEKEEEKEESDEESVVIEIKRNNIIQDNFKTILFVMFIILIKFLFF